MSHLQSSSAFSLQAARESQPKLGLLVVGFGNIASYWLTHFAAQLPKEVVVVEVFNSKGEVTADALPIPLSQLASRLSPTLAADTSGRVTQHINALRQSNIEVAVLDLTASKAVSRYYLDWVTAGAHLISANKYAGSSAPEYYQRLRHQLMEQQRHWLYNTTVGAGLPIQSAINERLRCHDEILALEGNFSGSLSWVFQHYRPGDKFSDWLRQAAELGMTEPDPRVDLAGMDVARKLLILARESGWQLSLADIDIENLVPDTLRDVSVEEFWQRIEVLDATIAKRSGDQFHYIGRIEKLESGRVAAVARLREIPAGSAYASLPPGNANFVIQSRQYRDNPMLIQGPGAGREVTAAGVHSDVLTLLRELQ